MDASTELMRSFSIRRRGFISGRDLRSSINTDDRARLFAALQHTH